MKYSNSFCFDCRKKTADPEDKLKMICSVDRGNPNKLYDINKNEHEKIEIKDTNALKKVCEHFDDLNVNIFRVECEHRKYGDELRLIKRLKNVMNGDFGVSRFEATIHDYLRTKANQRGEKEDFPE